MEIETKIFDTKRVRKVLDKKGIEPKRVCDVVDYLFDIAHFSAKNWRFSYPGGKKSGLLGVQTLSVEVPDVDVLMDIQEFFQKHKEGIKVRIRVVDTIPFLTCKGPKKQKKGIKSREEVETRIGSLSDMMYILLLSGAELKKTITRTRAFYRIPHYPHSELVLDVLHLANGNVEYAELESPSMGEVEEILRHVFGLSKKHISDAGISDIYDKKMEKTLSDRIKYLAEITQK